MKHLISLFPRRITSHILLSLAILSLSLALQVCGPWGVQAMETEGEAMAERAVGKTFTSPPTARDSGDRAEEVAPRDTTSVLTVNLAWVCDKPIPQPYVYPATTEDELKSRLLDRAASWALLHPADDINIWYDGQLVSPTAVSATQAVLEQKYRASPNIKLKDLRHLPTIQRYPSAVHPNLSVFFRVDLYRLVSAAQLLSGRENDIFVYADIDMEAVDCHQIIQAHREELAEYGILMAKGRYTHRDGYLPYFENGFQIIRGDPILLRILEETIIRPSIARGQWVASLWGSTEPSIYTSSVIGDWELLGKANHKSPTSVKEAVCSLLEESVYNAYWQAFFRLHEYKKHVELTIMDLEGILAECRPLFEITEAHVNFFPNLEYGVAKLLSRHILIERDSQEPCLYVPTVDVPIPPSRFLEK